jgi:hypothetical protein
MADTKRRRSYDKDGGRMPPMATFSRASARAQLQVTLATERSGKPLDLPNPLRSLN